MSPILALTVELEALQRFLLVACRMGGAFAVGPLFGSERTPARAKAALAALVAVVLAPAAHGGPPLDGPLGLALAAAGELALGLAIGFGAMLVFAAVQMAGALADMQSAFGFAGVVSPETGEQTSVIGQLHLTVAWLIFLALNGHHVLLEGLADSLRAAPLGAHPAASAPALAQALGATMSASVQMAAPIVGAVLLADFALGLLSRAAPQMNLLAVGFPVKMGVGLAAVVMALPLLMVAQRHLIGLMEATVRAVVLAAR